MSILGVIVIIGLVIIGVLYANMWKENDALREALEDGVQTIELPLKYIMFCAGPDSGVMELAQAALHAHAFAGVKIKDVVSNKECQKTIYENNDELIVYQYGAKIKPLKRHELNGYTLKIFFDDKLPAGAERVIIKQLGLSDCMVTIGICTNKTKGENK